MKPHPRIRKTIKWGGAVVTVLLVVVWVGSAWWSCYWFNSSVFKKWCVNIGRGRLAVVDLRSSLGNTPHWSLVPVEANRGMEMWFGWHTRGSGSLPFIAMPLWPFVGIAMFLTFFAWRRDRLAWRLAHPNPCPKCGYDRTGLAAGAVCPECGAVPVGV